MRAEYGKGLFAELSKLFTERFERGSSESTLKKQRKILSSLCSVNSANIVCRMGDSEKTPEFQSFLSILNIPQAKKKGQTIESPKTSTATMTKLSKGMSVNTDILLRICKEFQCDISDICEVINDDEYRG